MAEAASRQCWLPLTAAMISFVAVMSVLVLCGELQRSSRPLSRTVRSAALLDTAAKAAGMRFDPEALNPLEDIALIRGVPTMRMSAPDRFFSQVCFGLPLWNMCAGRRLGLTTYSICQTGQSLLCTACRYRMDSV